MSSAHHPKWRWIASLAVCLAAVGCADPTQEAPEATPEVRLETLDGCESSNLDCLWEDLERRLDGALIHRRLEGHPQVAVRILFERSRFALSSDEYWAEQVALRLFEWRGRFQSTVTWSEAQAEIGAEIYTVSSDDFAGVVGVAPAPYWDELWALLSEELRPEQGAAAPPDQAARSLDSWVSSRGDEAAEAASWEAWLGQRGTSLNDYVRDAQQSLARVDVEAVDRAWDALLARDGARVVVVGPQAVGEVDAGVARTLERWPRAGVERGDEAERPEPLVQQAVLDYPDSDAWHVRGFFTGPKAASSDFAPLQLGLEVLSSQLFEQVRDENGLAYSVGANLSDALTTSGNLWLSTDQPERALAVARQTLVDVVEGATETQVDTARAQIVRRLLAEARTPEGMASLLGRFELTFGGPALDYVADLEGASAADVRAVLADYLHSFSLAAAGSGDELSSETLASLDPTTAMDGVMAALIVATPAAEPAGVSH